jgi:hypothetical protein
MTAQLRLTRTGQSVRRPVRAQPALCETIAGLQSGQAARWPARAQPAFCATMARIASRRLFYYSILNARMSSWAHGLGVRAQNCARAVTHGLGVCARCMLAVPLAVSRPPLLS